MAKQHRSHDHRSDADLPRWVEVGAAGERRASSLLAIAVPIAASGLGFHDGQTIPVLALDTTSHPRVRRALRRARTGHWRTQLTFELGGPVGEPERAILRITPPASPGAQFSLTIPFAEGQPRTILRWLARSGLLALTDDDEVAAQLVVAQDGQLVHIPEALHVIVQPSRALLTDILQARYPQVLAE